MQWSFSSLKMFLNCAKQYQEVRILKSFAKGDTEQTLYGKDVHSALERYGRDGTPLPPNYLRFKRTVDMLLQLPGQKLFEYEMALRDKLTPCGFNDEDYWVRGIADFVSLDYEKGVGYVIDYKTGSAKYPDLDQLKLMALMVFTIHPEIQEVRAGLSFLMHDSFVPAEYSRTDMPRMWRAFDDYLARLQAALDTDIWRPTPSGLCGWCPVVTCDFHRESR